MDEKLTNDFKGPMTLLFEKEKDIITVFHCKERIIREQYFRQGVQGGWYSHYG